MEGGVCISWGSTWARWRTLAPWRLCRCRATGRRSTVRWRLWRFRLGTPYPEVVAEVERLVDTPPLRGQCALVIDGTGCGRAVVDMCRAAKVPAPIAISIHGGDQVTQDGLYYRVPKRDLCGCVQVLLQQRRLRIAQALPEAQTLYTELVNFKVKIDPATAHDSYSSWRERDHDDLVLALAVACWWAERLAGERVPADLDLSRGLVGTQMPSHWRDPQASARPRLGRLRVFNDTYPDSPHFDERSWEAAKRAVGEGLPVPRSPHAP